MRSACVLACSCRRLVCASDCERAGAAATYTRGGGKRALEAAAADDTKKKKKKKKDGEARVGLGVGLGVGLPVSNSSAPLHTGMRHQSHGEKHAAHHAY